jgi:hypothetical protein
MRARHCGVLLAFAALLVVPSLSLGARSQAPAQQESAAGWIDRADEIAAFLREAEVVRVEDIGVGVTNPKRAYVAPGGPVESFMWKPIEPGLYRGYWESYKAEVAAYELDKVLGLHMVPVTVERRLSGDVGAAMMWLSPTRSFTDMGGIPTPPDTHLGRWNLQLIRAKMFDNLIYNIDPNQGNWLVDPSWNLFLIDHSRAFTDGKKLVQEMTRIDRALWDRMKELDQATLTTALGSWMGEGEIRAILERRDLMADAIARLVSAQGEANVFVTGETTAPQRVRLPADTAIRDLTRRAQNAIETPNFLPPASAIMWSGRLVALAGLDGPHAEAAERGVAGGHSLGLVTRDRLVFLAPDPNNRAAYDSLSSLVGRQVEIFGPASVRTPTVVQVMRAAEGR